jgi:beta-N-acetylhexosaminidase
MPRLEIRRFIQDPIYRARIRSAITKAIAGGFCIFNGSISDAKKILEELQTLSQQEIGEPLLFACDCEWGLSMRLTGNATEFPHALALANSSYPNAVYEAAFAIGKEMKELGLHWNFAPVADINSNPENPIINIRSFGNNAETVAKSVIAYSEGLQDAGIIATAKHFPGHGDTKIDSHTSMPVLDLPVEHFEKIEFIPFIGVIQKGISTIMTGHLAAPQLASSLGANLEQSKQPATVSPFLIKRLLREQLGFDGVIITDSLEMAAIRTIFATEAILCAASVHAGCDILLMPMEFEVVHAALSKQYKEDEEFATIVNRSNERILTLYEVTEARLKSEKSTSDDLAFSIAQQAIVISGERQLLHSLKHYKIICDDEQLQANRKMMLESLLRDMIPSLTREDNLGMGQTVTFILQRPRGKLLDEHTNLYEQTPVERFIKEMEDQPIDCIFLLGNPYLETKLPEARCIIKTFSDSAPSIRAAIDFLYQNR